MEVAVGLKDEAGMKSVSCTVLRTNMVVSKGGRGKGRPVQCPSIVCEVRRKLEERVRG